MKTAKAISLIAIVICPDPNCGAGIQDPDNDTYDWTSDTRIPPTVVCPDCKTRFKMPMIKFA